MYKSCLSPCLLLELHMSLFVSDSILLKSLAKRCELKDVTFLDNEKSL